MDGITTDIRRAIIDDEAGATSFVSQTLSISMKIPLCRRLLKMIGGLATCSQTIGRIPIPCWTRSPPPKFKLFD